MSGSRCPDTLDGNHGPIERNGRCRWCAKRLYPPLATPIPRVAVSELSSAYRYYYDPDFGNDRRDAYP